MGALNIRRRLVKNVSAQMMANAISSGIGLFTTAILSRYLGVEWFGKFNYIFAFFYFFLSFNDFGMNTIVIREVSQRREQAGELIGAMLSFKFLLAILSMIIAWITIWLMDFPTDLRNAMSVFALILPVTALELPVVMYQILLKMNRPSMFAVLNKGMSFLLMMGVVWAGYRLTALAAALVLAEVALLIVLLRDTRALVRPVWRISPALWANILRSSVPLGIAGLFGAIINRVDFLMLERMTDMHQLGLYSAAYKVTGFLEAPPLMIMGVIYPLMSRYAREDSDKLRVLYKKSTLGLALVALMIGLVVTVFAPTIVRLMFGHQFAGTDRCLRVLVWATVCLYAALSGGNLLISMGKELVGLSIVASAALINVLLNLLWIPLWGFVGAALATTLAYFFILVTTTVAAKRALTRHPPGPAALNFRCVSSPYGGVMTKTSQA